ncbi:MAG: NAD(P)H-dependent oxidoreductase [Gemmatimonadetes bacterium]|jgi:NAD(P)H-dependent FMN reductase|nr:NAD(P)H-dependent oxidoreductase [Gemmatimonadota bacterium]MBT4610937.1 NAD(P)H-dependent oxidoreductase [Gemmatimonadota bacterium]MBT5056746.1 NAD(P)H-dependent oxidoreductase [Gemmatimonadota bacterium]MBT5146648.1 NAD(P)H-dependent oxidoreductase [Gemmatimonadota bacterium]MBT5587925.1 NAD(P)H-dependent oxidoreductase [Gemmatimonadota bacterium]
MEKTSSIKVVAIIGSVRPDSYTSKAVALVGDEFRERYPEVDFNVVDPRHLNLPGPQSDTADAKSMQKMIGDATGVILSTPEYHGSYSSAIKLVIENMGFPSGLSAKPVAMLGVAAGRIGAIKALEHLSSVVTHVGGLVLPGFVSVAGVQDVFDDEGKCTDPSTDERIRGLAKNLMDYTHEFLCPGRCMEETVRQD